MARLGCICGAEMTNTLSPSKHRLNIYYLSEVQQAIEKNPRIRLWDFYTGWDEKNSCENSFENRLEPVEYWHCSECGRIYEVQAIPCGKKIRTYVPCSEEFNVKMTGKAMKEILPLTDVEMDELLEEDDKLLLAEYISKKQNIRYFLNETEDEVYRQEDDTELLLLYRQEEIQKA